MAQSLSIILIHVVYSTKDRYPFLTPEIRPQLHAYMAKVMKGIESPALIINSVADHVHVLFRLSKNHALCDVIQNAKSKTSKWIKTKGQQFSKFQWQAGYGAFSVSSSNVEQVKQYIADQEEHHQRVSFEDELRALLRKHGIEFDERYMWD